MKQIYLDRLQCEYFGLPYFPECEEVRLDVKELLNSKIQGYDQEHTEFLQPLKKIWLVKICDRQRGPGWYEVVKCEPNEDFGVIIENNRLRTRELHEKIEQEIIY